MGGPPESNAIIFHLAEGSRFLPADRFERAAGPAMDVLRAVQPQPNIATARFVIHFIPPDDERRQACGH